MSDCIFCKLANGEIPTQLVYEDEAVVAFHDLHPQAPVHVLIVPKKHVADIDTLAGHADGEKILGQVLRAIPKVADLVGIRQKGYRLINNCGPDAGQTIEHVHFHLLGGKVLGDKIV
ncbi:MAG: histidine triad nucleotide-binding protein [Eubacteriales bacterium]|nr:histidine triad nucleotide-binding protein [Eubacteriales bacterium]